MEQAREQLGERASVNERSELSGGGRGWQCLLQATWVPPKADGRKSKVRGRGRIPQVLLKRDRNRKNKNLERNGEVTLWKKLAGSQAAKTARRLKAGRWRRYIHRHSLTHTDRHLRWCQTRHSSRMTPAPVSWPAEEAGAGQGLPASSSTVSGWQRRPRRRRPAAAAPRQSTRGNAARCTPRTILWRRRRLRRR